jgi:hypothetical protein
MQGGIDGNEEIISSKRIFRNCLLWRVKRPVVNGYVGGRVRLLVMVSVFVFGARKMVYELLV